MKDRVDRRQSSKLFPLLSSMTARRNTPALGFLVVRRLGEA